jgi:hypothetical protein
MEQCRQDADIRSASQEISYTSDTEVSLQCTQEPVKLIFLKMDEFSPQLGTLFCGVHFNISYRCISLKDDCSPTKMCPSFVLLYYVTLVLFWLSIVIMYPRKRVWNTGTSKKLFYSLQRPDSLWGPPSLPFIDWPGAVSAEAKRSLHEVQHSSFTAEVKNDSRYTSPRTGFCKVYKGKDC